MTPDQWMDVMFSLERKLNIMRLKSALVRRDPGSDRYNPRFTIKTMKYPASLMVWGCFSRPDCRSSPDFLEKGVARIAVHYTHIMDRSWSPSSGPGCAGTTSRTAHPVSRQRSASSSSNRSESPYLTGQGTAQT